MKKKIAILSSTAIVLGAVIASSLVIASDHNEAGTASDDDSPADIGDMYVFHSGERLTLILTFDGYKLRSAESSYDADALYGLHIDTDGDNQADHDIYARFGQNTAGDWGVQVEGIPGVAAPLVGAVEDTLVDEDSGAQVYAGLRDDPFFFDVEGFKDTLTTGTVSFDPSRDFVALKNTQALVVEFDHAALGSTNIGVWVTTGRL